MDNCCRYSSTLDYCDYFSGNGGLWFWSQFVQGLMTNSYVLKITNEGYNDYESTSIDVEFGVLYEIAESIELLLVE